MDLIQKKLFFSGYSYRYSYKNKNSLYYKCSKYDSSGCKARLIVNGERNSLKGSHTCSVGRIVEISSINQDITPVEYTNSYIAQKAMQLELFPNQIYQSLLLDMREKYGTAPYPIPKKSAVYSTIREQRSSIFYNSIQAATMPPLRDLPNSQPFFRRYWSGDIDGEYHQMLLWCTNEALSLMRYNSHTFIDCTFRSVPSPFLQCLIVMVYDAGTQLFVPCAYSLITTKNEYMYLTVFHELIVLTKYSWMPQIITSDFEISLIASIKHEFPTSRLLCCYFHLKKAIERKLKNYKISDENSKIILNKIELITIVPIEDIEIAIRYAKSLTTEQPELISFWNYFEIIWRKRFDPQLWNLSSINDQELAGRTNNALERYNRRLGEHFANAHPNLPAFIAVIKTEFLYFSERCNEIRQNSSGIDYQPQRFSRPLIDQHFISWKHDNYST